MSSSRSCSFSELLRKRLLGAGWGMRKEEDRIILLSFRSVPLATRIRILVSDEPKSALQLRLFVNEYDAGMATHHREAYVHLRLKRQRSRKKPRRLVPPAWIRVAFDPSGVESAQVAAVYLELKDRVLEGTVGPGRLYAAFIGADNECVWPDNARTHIRTLVERGRQRRQPDEDGRQRAAI